MIWAFKMFFKIIGYVFIYTFAFVITLILLPFYGIYALCGGNSLSQRKRKKKMIHGAAVLSGLQVIYGIKALATGR
jgi:hypothetical protein